MASDPANDTDAEREQTYKRGFTHGVAKAISAIAPKLTPDERTKLDAWFKDEVVPWEQDAEPSLSSPEFPMI